MPTTYDPANVHHAQIDVPEDGDLATGLSLAGIEQVADNCEHVRQALEVFAGTNLAHTNVDNHFSVEQHITGQLTTTGHINSGASIYGGPGGQVHSQTNVVADDHVIADKNVSAVHGNVSAPNGTVSGAAVSAAGAITGATITGGTIHANTDLSCGGEITAAGHVNSDAGSFYAQAPGAKVQVYANVVALHGNVLADEGFVRATEFNHPGGTAATMQVAMCEGQVSLGPDNIGYNYLEDSFDSGGDVSVATPCRVTFRLRLPAGATLTGVDVLHKQPAAADQANRFSLVSNVVLWSGGIGATSTHIGSLNQYVNPGTGVRVTPLDLAGDHPVGTDEVVTLTAEMRQINAQIQSVRVHYINPGPRNT
jgi:hypothetical protein